MSRFILLRRSVSVCVPQHGPLVPLSLDFYIPDGHIFTPTPIDLKRPRDTQPNKLVKTPETPYVQEGSTDHGPGLNQFCRNIFLKKFSFDLIWELESYYFIN